MSARLTKFRVRTVTPGRARLTKFRVRTTAGLPKGRLTGFRVRTRVDLPDICFRVTSGALVPADLYRATSAALQPIIVKATGNAPRVGYLTRSGSKLYGTNGLQWRGNGANWHWAAMLETAVKNGLSNVYPTHAQIDEVFTDAVAQGVTWMRVHTVGISAGLPQSLVTGINADASLVWNAAAWEPIDYVISKARAANIRLFIPMTDQHNYYHLGKAWWVRQAFIRQASSGIPSSYTYDGTTETGVTSYAMPAANSGFSGTARAKKIEQQFYALPWLRTAFITNYTGAWLEHVNQFTGVANKNEPMVAFLSAGNELWDSGTAYSDHAGTDGVNFQKAFSALVKSKQPGIMVVDPMGSYGGDPSACPGATDSNTDIIDVDHIYTGGAAPAAGYIDGKIAKATALGKASMFGEYSLSNSGITSILSQFEQNANCTGGAYWAIYSQSEPHSSGGNDDSVYLIGSNASWKTAMQNHSAVMSGGTPPVAAPLVNLMRVAAAANSESAVSTYAAGSTDSADPTLAIEASTGVSGSAVKVTSTTPTATPGHKWVYVNDIAAAAPVTPGQTYTATAHAKLVSGSLSSGYYGHITWFTSSGSYISGQTSSAAVATSGSYSQVTYSGVAPANAAFAVPQIEWDGPAQGATAVVLIDQWGIFAGNNASPWTSP